MKKIKGVATGASSCRYDTVTRCIIFTCNDGTELSINVPNGLTSTEKEMLSHMTLEGDAVSGYYLAVDGNRVGGTYTGVSENDIGGIKKGDSFTEATLQDMFDKLLKPPYTKPKVTLGLAPATTIYDKVSDTLSSITINADVTKNSENIASVRFYIDDVLVSTDTTHPNGGLVSYTYNFPTPTNTTFNVKIECEDTTGASSKVSANTNINFVGKSYYGTVEDDGNPFTITETLVKGLTGTVLKIKKAYTFENSSVTFGRTIYAYPKDLPDGGLLTSIKDKVTGWSMIDSYAHEEINIDGIDYLCYYLIDPAGYSDVTTIFA